MDEYSLAWAPPVTELKVVDRRYQVQILVVLVDLAIWSFLWFSPKLA